MPNQYSHSRRWREEVIETASRLNLCVVLPERLTANTRIKSACVHGEVKETTVYRLIERQFCCKSQASKAVDPSLRSHAASVYWSTNPERKPQSEESNRKRSETLKGVDNSFVPTPEQRLLPGILYFVRYEDEGEHYKIGITRRTIQERLRTRLIEVVATYESTLGECWDLEQRILKDLDEFRYSSETTTELFRPEALTLILDRLGHFPN